MLSDRPYFPGIFHGYGVGVRVVYRVNRRFFCSGPADAPINHDTPGHYTRSGRIPSGGSCVALGGLGCWSRVPAWSVGASVGVVVGMAKEVGPG